MGEAVKLYQLNMAVVLAFPTGARATIKAFASLASHTPAWVLLGLAGLGASTAYMLLRQ